MAGEEAGVPAEPLGREDAEHPLCERRPQRVPLRQRSARQSPGTSRIIQLMYVVTFTRVTRDFTVVVSFGKKQV